VLAACSAPVASSPVASRDAAPDRAGTVDVGGDREIYLKCHGDGSPTVVLVSGLGESAETWSTRSEEASTQTPTVYDGVADFTRVCAYDRPGTTDSRSSEVAQPTSAQISADDLQKLLVASGEAGPFVLAGHSYGGPISRLFAADHADEVAGLVLVDALSEDLGAGLTPAQTAIFEALNAPPQQSRAESFDYRELVTELQGSPPAPDVPVIVLTADRPQLTPEALASGQLPPGVDQAFADALWAAQMAAQDLLSAKFANATHITDTASDHYIQSGNPQLVIDAIRDVVDRARG
jgi:pimeloyl-ACP methyl ester carboxylesterase